MSDVLLNVSHIRHRSRVNGPGTRCVVWVQGCTLNCPGCFNKHTHPHKPIKLLDPEQLGKTLLRIDDIEGLSISGGEPFEQAHACAILARTFQGAGRPVLVFSGYPYECLKDSSDRSAQELLSNIDLLIAGPYIERLKINGNRWRTSTNQRVLALTDRYAEIVNQSLSDEPVIEVTADGEGFCFTGFPGQDDLRWLGALGSAADKKRTVASVTDHRNYSTH